MHYLYTAWFRDGALPSEESDREWSTCFVIAANSEREAAEWGDYLAMQRVSTTKSLDLLSSKVESTDSWPYKKIQNVPRVKYGEQFPERQIAW